MAEFLTVACKLPHGIHMDLHFKDRPRERVTLKGNNSSRVIGGYGITENVPKEHFEQWMKMNRSHPAVTGGLIFSHGQTASAEAKAREQAEFRHGMERINPDAIFDDSRLGMKKPKKGEEPMIETMTKDE